jgi:hypothetical protein
MTKEEENGTSIASHNCQNLPPSNLNIYRQVELAQADGRWEAAYDGQSKASVPEDLQSELNKNQTAQTFFNTLDRTNLKIYPSYLRETRQVIGSYTLFPVLTCGETRSHPRRAPKAWRSEFFVGNQANTFYR